MDAQIIRFLRDISTPFTDWLFYGITFFGGEIFFIIIGVILFWTVDKKYAHKFVMTVLIVSAINLGLKAIFKRPRPYTLNDIDAPLDYYTAGYSFPSGHATNAAALGYTAIDGSKKTKYHFLKYIAIFLMVFIPLSRMVLAQHYLTDVLVGLVLSYILVYYLFKLIDKFHDKEEYYTLAILPIVIILMPIIKDTDMYVAGGGFMGFAIGYFIEKHYIKYDVRNKLPIQLLKIIIGFIGIIMIKELPKLIFDDSHLFDFIRYTVIGGWAAVGAPLTFKYVFKHQEEKI